MEIPTGLTEPLRESPTAEVVKLVVNPHPPVVPLEGGHFATAGGFIDDDDDLDRGGEEIPQW